MRLGRRIYRRHPVPRHEFVPAAGWPIACDPGDDIGDIGVRVDAVGLAGLNDNVDGRGTLAVCARAGEQPVAASHSDAAQRTLRDVVVDLQASIAEEARQRRPSLGAIGDAPGHVGPG